MAPFSKRCNKKYFGILRIPILSFKFYFHVNRFRNVQSHHAMQGPFVGFEVNHSFVNSHLPFFVGFGSATAGAFSRWNNEFSRWHWNNAGVLGAGFFRNVQYFFGDSGDLLKIRRTQSNSCFLRHFLSPMKR